MKLLYIMIIHFIVLILTLLLINYDIFFGFTLMMFLVNEFVSKYLNKNNTHINIHNLEFWKDAIDTMIIIRICIYKIIKNKDIYPKIFVIYYYI